MSGGDLATHQSVIRNGKRAKDRVTMLAVLVKAAVRDAEIAVQPTGHTRTVQELLGHSDVSATMIYTHVLSRGPAGVRSPADRMFLP